MSPMWFLETASGFTIDKVRSIAMIDSYLWCKLKNLPHYTDVITNNQLESVKVQ